QCTRGYIIHAKDGTYQWELTREWEWPRKRETTWGGEWPEKPETDESFLRPVYVTSTAAYEFPATLANYFDHPFGENRRLCAFRIRSKEANYRFAKDERKVIRVGLDFLQEDECVRLVDLRDGLDCWDLRVVTPSGRRVHRPVKELGMKERDPKAWK